MFQTKGVENIKTCFIFNAFCPKNCPVYDMMWQNTVRQTGRRWQYYKEQNRCILHAG
jgi:hypothetical protein